MCQRLGTPKTPANPFHAGAEFRGFHGSLICYGLPGCSAPCTDLTGFPAIGAFYFQASNGLVALPVAGYDYSIDWTPMLAGLSPAGMAARLAARRFFTFNGSTALARWETEGVASFAVTDMGRKHSISRLRKRSA